MKHPVMIVFDPEVTKSERRVVVNATERACQITGRKAPLVAGTRLFKGEEIIHAEDALNEVTSGRLSIYGEQVDAGRLHDILTKCQKYRGEHHILLFVTARDLTANGLNYCFGYSLGTVAIVSIARYRDMVTHDLRIMLRGVTLHELGHAFGAPSNLKRAKTESRIGVHCLNPHCVMRQGLDPVSMLRIFKTTDLFNPYCSLCRNDIDKY